MKPTPEAIEDLESSRAGESAVDDGSREYRRIGGPQSVRILDRQGAVVDGGQAAVGVAARVAEGDRARAFLDQVLAGAQVADLAGDVQNAGRGPEVLTRRRRCSGRWCRLQVLLPWRRAEVIAPVLPTPGPFRMRRS